jgi:hypothetical protein
MAKQIINRGTTANDGSGDTLREAMDKINANFTELYNGQDGIFSDAPVDSNGYIRLNAAWISLDSAQVVSDTGIDGNLYGRRDNSWVQIPNNLEAPLTGLTYGRVSGAWARVAEEANSDGTSYVRKNGAWEVLPAFIGDAPSDGTEYVRRDSAWVSLNAVVGIGDAPPGGQVYARQDSAWIDITDTLNASGITDVPSDNVYYTRRNEDWVNVELLIDSDYINSRVDANIDSAALFGLIDSDYINSRVDATVDSSAVISLINANTLDSADIINLIDSDYVNARVTSSGSGEGIDSDAVTNLIDSDYVQARVVLPNVSSSVYYDSANLSPGSSLHVIPDSADITYVRAAGEEFTATIRLPYSGNVGSGKKLRVAGSARADVEAFEIVVDSNGGGTTDIFANGNTTFDFSNVRDNRNPTKNYIDFQLVNNTWFFDDSGGTDYYRLDRRYFEKADANTAVPYVLNDQQIVLLDSAQLTAAVGSIWEQGGGSGGLDSAQIRAFTVDSAEVLNLIDAAYIQANQNNFLDSDNVINLIDSDYVALRAPSGGSLTLAELTTVTLTNPTDGQVLKFDSDTAQWVNAVDATGGSGGGLDSDAVKAISVDSAEVLALIDSDYINSRINNSDYKFVTLIGPTDSDEFAIGRYPVQTTITKLVGVIEGGTSCNYSIRYDSDRSAAGTEVVTGGSTVSSTTTGDEVTSFNSAVIPPGSWIWLEMNSVSGTVEELNVSIEIEK